VRRIRSATVVGAGHHGGGIADETLQTRGIPVTVLDAERRALARGSTSCAGIRECREEKARKLSPERAGAEMGSISGTMPAQDLAGADIVIEAVFEDLE